MYKSFYCTSKAQMYFNKKNKIYSIMTLQANENNQQEKMKLSITQKRQ